MTLYVLTVKYNYCCIIQADQWTI